MKNNFILIVLFITLFTACKKEEALVYDTNTKANLVVKFDNIAGGADLQLNTGNYTNAAGESFKVNMLKYFVSNFTATRVDGSTYVVPQDSCYFLIDESNVASTSPVLKVPEGEYSKISFVLGIDSLRNTKDISQRTGVLDPAGAAAGMYWSWNSGYIFYKMEGISPASTQAGNVFKFHIGLFGGYSTPTLNNIKKITIDLSARGTAKVKAGRSSDVHLTVDALKVFTGTTNVSLAANSVVMASSYSATVAANYSNMFAHDHTHN